MVSDSQRKASQKYDKEKVEQFRLRVPKGKRELIKKCAAINGESINQMICRLINDELKRNGLDFL